MLKIVALIAALLAPSLAQAQQPTMSPNTVLCRLGISPGPGQACPFATLLSQLGGPYILPNGATKGLYWKNSAGNLDASFAEFASGNLILQMSGNNVFDITDAVGNPIATFASPQGTINGAVQSQMLSGNCGVGDEDMTISGTPTAGEQPGFSLTVGATTATVTYTVQNGDTNNSIAAGLAAAAIANPTFKSLVNGACPNGTIYNGIVTPVALGNNQMGFDAVYTADPNKGGNSFTGINSTHTTITTIPVSTLAGALYHADTIFVAGRDANVGDVPFQYQLIFQDSAGNSAAYFTETYTVLGTTPGAVRIDKDWVLGPCGFDFLANTGEAFIESNNNCDLNLVANGATTNNVNLSSGSAGGINLNPGSGAATVTKNNIGVTSTDGLVIRNPTAAANGAQQWSPRLHFQGQGWKTNSTAASEPVDWIVENQTTQAGGMPSSALVFSVAVNGGAYSVAMVLNSTGVVQFGEPLVVSQGGTNCGSASGTCLDNISGFSSTGVLNRTGAGTYSFLTGITQTCTVNQAKTLVFTLGVLTSGTCNS